MSPFAQRAVHGFSGELPPAATSRCNTDVSPSARHSPVSRFKLGGASSPPGWWATGDCSGVRCHIFRAPPSRTPHGDRVVLALISMHLLVARARHSLPGVRYHRAPQRKRHVRAICPPVDIMSDLSTPCGQTTCDLGARCGHTCPPESARRPRPTAGPPITSGTRAPRPCYVPRLVRTGVSGRYLRVRQVDAGEGAGGNPGRAATWNWNAVHHQPGWAPLDADGPSSAGSSRARGGPPAAGLIERQLRQGSGPGLGPRGHRSSGSTCRSAR